MKRILTLLPLLFVVILLFAGGRPLPTVTYTPANPEVGDLVTFTLSDAYDRCYGSESFADFTLDPDNANAAVFFEEFVATHTYTAPGTYIVALDDGCPPMEMNVTSEVQAVVLGNGAWVLRDANGRVSANKTIVIGADTIPTMGEWGVIVLGILLLIVAVAVIPEISGQVGKRDANIR